MIVENVQREYVNLHFGNEHLLLTKQYYHLPKDINLVL